MSSDYNNNTINYKRHKMNPENKILHTTNKFIIYALKNVGLLTNRYAGNY